MSEIIKSASAINLDTFEFDLLILSQELIEEEDIGEQSEYDEEERINDGKE